MGRDVENNTATEARDGGELLGDAVIVVCVGIEGGTFVLLYLHWDGRAACPPRNYAVAVAAVAVAPKAVFQNITAGSLLLLYCSFDLSGKRERERGRERAEQKSPTRLPNSPLSQ